MSAEVTKIGEYLRRKRPGHAISDDGRDYGPELCSRCLSPDRVWCDECGYHFCARCHRHDPEPAA